MLTGPIPKLVDYRKLAAQDGQLEGSIPVGQLTRLGELLAAKSGDVQVDLYFGNSASVDDAGGNAGRVKLDGHVSVEVQMICQNCMEQFSAALEGDFGIIVVSDEAELSALEDDEDGYICPEKLLDVSELIEDELLLLVPMIPRHADGECQGNEFEPDSPADGEAASQETYRPFADLAAVLKEGKKTES